MLFTMGVSLFTSRVVLQTLGVEDYGIFNVVGGVVVLFTFINNTMVTAIQRFLNFELGRGDQNEVKRIFSASINIQIFVAILTFILAETVGLWFLYNYINCPPDRVLSAHIVYHFSVLSTCVNIIRAPYNASIVAYERMSFYAYISIIETILRLLIVYVLIIIPVDKLSLYGILTFVVTFIIMLGYVLYCKRTFDTCKYTLFWDKKTYSHLLSFSGWSLFGGVANIGASQGLNVLMNIFCGVTVNAAMGIANQVHSAVYSFVSNFQTAFNPQIVKSYAAEDKKYFFNLLISTSKYSYFLLYAIVLPILMCCDDLLFVWLEIVPEHAVSFCKLMLIFSLLDAIQGPLWVSVQATGKIKNYQILMSLLILSNLPLSYLALKMSAAPEIVLLIKVFINVVVLVVRLIYLHFLFQLPVKRYLMEVLAPISIVTTVSYTLMLFVPQSFGPLPNMIAIVGISLLCNLLLVYSVGLNSTERSIIKQVVQKFINR